MEELSQPFSTSDISPKFIPNILYQSLHFGDDGVDNDSIDNDDCAGRGSSKKNVSFFRNIS